jgi:hypothetical protein
MVILFMPMMWFSRSVTLISRLIPIQSSRRLWSSMQLANGDSWNSSRVQWNFFFVVAGSTPDGLHGWLPADGVSEEAQRKPASKMLITFALDCFRAILHPSLATHGWLLEKVWDV